MEAVHNVMSCLNSWAQWRMWTIYREVVGGWVEGKSYRGAHRLAIVAELIVLLSSHSPPLLA